LREIRLNKLIDFVKNNPSYTLQREQDRLVVYFNTPSIEDAGGQGDLNKVYVITFSVHGDKAVLESCKITDGKEEREVGEEIDFWLDYLDSE